MWNVFLPKGADAQYLLPSWRAIANKILKIAFWLQAAKAEGAKAEVAQLMKRLLPKLKESITDQLQEGAKKQDKP